MATNPRPAPRLAAWLFHLHPPEEVVVLASAVVVGLGTGLAAVVFIDLMARIADGVALVQARIGTVAGLLAVMAVAGLVVGFVVERWVPEAKGHGVPEVMEAMALRGGHIRARVAALKLLASSLTIGAGGSAGREGPIVQVGSALGSALGQLFHISTQRIRILVACGAAGGIAATFNAPIAGAIFALEIILGSFTVSYFGAVVISSVCAAIVSRMFLSALPAFAVPAYSFTHLGELPLYLLVGLLAAGVAVLFIRLLYWMEDRFDGMRWLPAPLRYALGMGLCAVVALPLPGQEVLGPGLHNIGETVAANFQMSLGMMAALLLLKLVATSLTLGSGNSGGIFAPSLFMGAALGGFLGTVAHGLWPQVAVNPGAYAIVGMAAVFAGAARAPITAVLIVFEMSNDYAVILPLMLATVLATYLAQAWCRESIYTMKLARKGIRLRAGLDLELLAGVSVGDVMDDEVHAVPETTDLATVSDLLAKTGSHGLVVLGPAGRFRGMVQASDLDRAIHRNLPMTTAVGTIALPRERLVVASPDESAAEALTRMGIRGFDTLPVVSTDEPVEVLGLAHRDDLLRAYSVAVSHRRALHHQAHHVRRRHGEATEFVEVMLADGDRAVGQAVADLGSDLPAEAILISIRRDGRTLIPHGSTRLASGDRVTAFTRSEDALAVLAALEGPPGEAQAG
jgi:CIC family chloride channel protein